MGHGNGHGTTHQGFTAAPAAGAQHFASVPAQEPIQPGGIKETISGIASEVEHRFGREIDEVKQLAVDAAISALGGLAAKQFPAFSEQIKELTQRFRGRARTWAAPRST